MALKEYVGLSRLTQVLNLLKGKLDTKPDLDLIGNVETVGTASKNDYSANTGLFINSSDQQLYGAITDISTGDTLSPYPSGGENSNCGRLNGYNVLNLIVSLHSFVDSNNRFAGVGYCTTSGATAVKTVSVAGTVNIESVIGIIFTNTNTATESNVKIEIESRSGIQTYDIFTREPDSRAYGVANYMSLYTVISVVPSEGEGDPYEELEFIGSFAPDPNQVSSTSIKEIKVVSELPSDAASHTDTLYLIPEA